MGKRKREISEFGAYLVKAIDDAGMQKTDFYTAVGIKKPYFYETLTSAPPPRDTLEKMAEVLERRLPSGEDRRGALFDLAAKYRREIPADIYDLIREHPEQWDHIRAALETLLADPKSTTGV